MSSIYLKISVCLTCSSLSSGTINSTLLFKYINSFKFKYTAYIKQVSRYQTRWITNTEFKHNDTKVLFLLWHITLHNLHNHFINCVSREMTRLMNPKLCRTYKNDDILIIPKSVWCLVVQCPSNAQVNVMLRGGEHGHTLGILTQKKHCQIPHNGSHLIVRILHIPQGFCSLF